MLSLEERLIDRYGRQLLLKEIGEKGQERLASARVVAVGCGALGTTAANLLARAGVGTLILIDRDIVEISNLQRQVLYDETDIDRPKAMAAAEALQQVNQDIEIIPKVEDVNSGNIESLIKGSTVLVDGTDNMDTRFLINDACLKLGIPWIYGGAVSTNGMSMTVKPDGAPCFSCVFPNNPPPGSLPTCENVGVLNTVTSFIGTVQATEATKVVVGAATRSGLLVVDVWAGEQRVLDVSTRTDCPACQKKEFEHLSTDPSVTGFVTTLCGRNSVQVRPSGSQGIDLYSLSEKLRTSGQVTVTSNHVRFRTSEHDIMVFKDGRAMIKGTEDPGRARAIYDRFIGH